MCGRSSPQQGSALGSMLVQGTGATGLGSRRSGCDARRGGAGDALALRVVPKEAGVGLSPALFSWSLDGSCQGWGGR